MHASQIWGSVWLSKRQHQATNATKQAKSQGETGCGDSAQPDPRKLIWKSIFSLADAVGTGSIRFALVVFQPDRDFFFNVAATVRLLVR